MLLRRVRLLLLAPLLLAATPAGAAEPLAVPGASSITAYGDQVVFSRADPVTGAYRLVRLVDGTVQPLPVKPRSVPFDADAGPDTAGRPVVVYSRCRVEPLALGTYPGGGAPTFGAGPSPDLAAGPWLRPL